MKQMIFLITILTIVTLQAETNTKSKNDKKVESGKKVFAANCAICHTINGGNALGPDMNLVSYTRTKEEIEYYAKDPYSLAEAFGYSANAMPTLPLEDHEFKDVAAYIESLQPFKKWMKKKS